MVTIRYGRLPSLAAWHSPYLIGPPIRFICHWRLNVRSDPTGLEPMSATDMVATPHWGARSLSVEKGTDEISATGGRQFLSPPRSWGPVVTGSIFPTKAKGALLKQAPFALVE